MPYRLPSDSEVMGTVHGGWYNALLLGIPPHALPAYDDAACLSSSRGLVLHTSYKEQAVRLSPLRGRSGFLSGLFLGSSEGFKKVEHASAASIGFHSLRCLLPLTDQLNNSNSNDEHKNDHHHHHRHHHHHHHHHHDHHHHHNNNAVPCGSLVTTLGARRRKAAGHRPGSVHTSSAPNNNPSLGQVTCSHPKLAQFRLGSFEVGGFVGLSGLFRQGWRPMVSYNYIVSIRDILDQTKGRMKRRPIHTCQHKPRSLPTFRLPDDVSCTGSRSPTALAPEKEGIQAESALVRRCQVLPGRNRRRNGVCVQCVVYAPATRYPPLHGGLGFQTIVVSFLRMKDQVTGFRGTVNLQDLGF